MNDVVSAAGETTIVGQSDRPAATATQETPQAETTPSAEATPERPDWLPEKFADGAALAESYKQLEQKLHNPERQEELRTSLIEELKAEKMEGVPDDATGYQIPEGFGTEETIDPAIWEATRNWAFERNLSQDDLGELVSFYSNTFLPNLDAEFEKLGPQAQARANALGAWVGANIPEQHRATIMNMAVTADNFQALEAMMKLTVPQAMPGQTETTQVGQTELASEAEIQQLMMSPQYTDPVNRDPNVVKQVDDWFAAKYPNT